ncbi:hypothetical protein KKB40_01225 [Patescibacteria group bacterium]|nr:hypothetical protein [Patescibacteria group bacterium]
MKDIPKPTPEEVAEANAFSHQLSNLRTRALARSLFKQSVHSLTPPSPSLQKAREEGLKQIAEGELNTLPVDVRDV